MSGKNRVLDIDIERYLLGELPAERARAVKAALDADPENQAKLSALKAENEAILEAYPPHLMAVQIRERAERETLRRVQARRRVLVPAISLSVAAAAALAVMVLIPGAAPKHPSGSDGPPVQIDPGIRIKGLEPKLFMYRLGDRGKEPLSQGQLVEAGDIIQWKFAALGQKYGVIFSVDGRGAVTLHYPSEEGGSTVLEKGTNEQRFSYQLDDAPDFERFFFVTSNNPIDVQSILDKGKKVGETGQLSLVGDLVSSDFVLKKKR